MLGCVTKDVASLCQTALGDLLRVFEPRLFLVGCVVCCRWVLWSDPVKSWHVSSCRPLLPAGQAWQIELSFLDDCFSLDSLSVSVYYQFFQGGGICSLQQPVVWLPLLTQAESVHHSASLPPGKVKHSLHLFVHYFCPGGLHLPTSCSGLCGSLQSSWCVFLTWCSWSFTWWNCVSSMMAQVGRSPTFSVCEIWWVQDIPNICRTCSAVLCFTFL
jgi:hypothetical protein